MDDQVVIYGISDIGLVRKNNEDMWGQVPEQHFSVLADGMGGHQAGEVAATMAVEELCSIIKNNTIDKRTTPKQISTLLYSSIQKVNQNIHEKSLSNEKYKGMGTTVCCLLVLQKELIYAHVGDSRIYRLRNNKLEQLTQDHSLLRELIELGQIDEKDSSLFAYKHIITRALGTEAYVEPSIQTMQVQPGDLLLMCSDGLSDLVKHDEIEKISCSNGPEELPKKLVAAAKQRGGGDNITVVVVLLPDQKK